MSEILATQLLSLSRQIVFASVEQELFSFSGDASKFKEWIKRLEKCSTVHQIEEYQTKLLAFKFAAGEVSDFIQRHFDSQPESTWLDLKTDLAKYYDEISDPYVKFKQLQTFRQEENESIQLFAQRLLTAAESIFENFDINEQFIQFQLVGIFADGINNESIKEKLVRENACSLDIALRIAMEEYKILTTCKQRARHAEQLTVQNSPKQKHRGTWSHNRHTQICTIKPQYTVRQNRKLTKIRRCFFCGSLKHIKKNCKSWKFLKGTSKSRNHLN